jgi:hypothetical protein
MFTNPSIRARVQIWSGPRKLVPAERRSISGLAMGDCDARDVFSLTPTPLPSGEG